MLSLCNGCGILSPLSCEGLPDPSLTQRAALIQETLGTEARLDAAPEASSSPIAQPCCPELGGSLVGFGGETGPQNDLGGS